jgi:methylase of polypeptide subunit release factors
MMWLIHGGFFDTEHRRDRPWRWNQQMTHADAEDQGSMRESSIGDGPFRTDRGTDCYLLREAFRRAGFEENAVNGILEGRSDRMIDTQCVLRCTAEASPLHSLIRLFILGVRVSEEEARLALAPTDVESLVDSGLLARSEVGVYATARLVPWRNLLLLSDFLPTEGESLPHDFVMSGASPSSLFLSRITLRDRVGAVLDLGTGAGIHALLAATHAERVVATDTNPRALNFARMNALLNGIGNISFRLGSFFEPVRDEKFDLIVSNPPFIISPESSLMFQNSGMGGDAVSELMVRQSPAHLRDLGRAVSLISWHHEDERDWSERPGEWAAGSGCDLWLLRATSESPLAYAANALRQTEALGSASYGKQLDGWLNYYRDQGISRLALGAAILRKRRAALNWMHCEDLAGAPVATDAGEQIQRVFAAEDFLTSLTSDDDLLDCRVALHPDHVLEQKLVAGDDGWVSRALILLPTKGIERRASIDPPVLMFLSQCNGSRTVRELIAAVAERDETDFAAAVTVGLPLVKRFLRAGFLVVPR